MGNEFSRAASCYLLAAQAKEFTLPGERMETQPPDSWPYAAELWQPDLENPIHCLVMARGFINKEIERLELEAKPKVQDAPSIL